MKQSFARFVPFLVLLAGPILACTSVSPPPILPGMLPTGDLVLVDDFKGNTLGWDMYDGVEGSTRIEDEQYKINIKIQYAEIWANPDPKYAIPDNVIIEVDTRSVASADNYYGLVCRYQDEKNFYFFVISEDGYYGIGKVKDGVQSLINRTEMPPSEAFDGSRLVKLRAECIGSRLALFANGVYLDDQEDSDLDHGRVGVLAGSYESEVTVLFDNLKVFSASP